MRGPRICSTPGCPELDCEAHARKPWAGRERPDREGMSGWKRQQRAKKVLARDAGTCHVCGQTGADEVDHVIPLAEGGEDAEGNLAAIHAEPCHAEKTRVESVRGRQRSGQPSIKAEPSPSPTRKTYRVCSPRLG